MPISFKILGNVMVLFLATSFSLQSSLFDRNRLNHYHIGYFAPIELATFTPSHGVKLGAEYYFNKKRKASASAKGEANVTENQTFSSFNFGGYNKTNNHWGVFADYEVGYKHISHKGAVYGVQGGVGAMFRQYLHDENVLDKDKYGVMPTASVFAGWNFIYTQKIPIMTLLKIGYFDQFPGFEAGFPTIELSFAWVKNR